MAFRIQDPASGLFWEVDGGYSLQLREKGTNYVQNSDGSIQNPESGMFVSYAGNRIIEDPAPKSWAVTENGAMMVDDVYFARFCEMAEGLGISSEPAAWVRVQDGAVAPEVPVAEPEVSEPEPEPEVESEEEDVPVVRSAALIEEALNAQAEEADEDKDIE